jgi:hypothetical protein
LGSKVSENSFRTNYPNYNGTMYCFIAEICLSYGQKVDFSWELLKPKVHQSVKSTQQSGNIKSSKQRTKMARDRLMCSVCGAVIPTSHRSVADAFSEQDSAVADSPGNRLGPLDNPEVPNSLYDGHICEGCRHIYCLNCHDPLKNYPDIDLFCPNCGRWSLQQLSRERL